MKFSVIIPVYNVAPYLRACLDSVLAAVGRLEEGSWSEEREVGERMNKLHSPTPTFNSNSLVEIICVDDGSTDGSGAILDEYWEKVERRGGGGRKVMGKGSDPLPERCSFRVIHQQNQGVSAARNAALDISTGEWVMMLDGDDTWEPWLLCRLRDIILQNPSCDAIGFGGVKVDEGGQVCDKFGDDCPRAIMTGDDILLNGRGPFSHFIWSSCDKMYRRSVIENHHLRYVKDIRIAEDSLFTQSFFAYAGNVYLDTGIKGYRCLVREGSATATGCEPSFCEQMAAFLSLRKIWCVTKKQGVLCRLRINAAGIPFCGKEASDAVRCEIIEQMLVRDDFNGILIPFLLRFGRAKARLFAFVYLFSPQCVRKLILIKLRYA